MRDDVFEPARREIRLLQSRIEDEEGRRRSIIDHAREHGDDELVVSHALRGLSRAIWEMQRYIIDLRAQIPPYAVLREDGNIELRPRTERIDPMERV